jgi:hypothetical protein
MMFRRSWQRLRNTYAWQPVGGLAILALLAGLMLDTLWVDYDRAAERLDNLDTELAALRMKAERLPVLEARAKQVDAEFGGVQGRLLVAQGEGAAGEKFGQQLRGWYEGKGVTQVAVRGAQRRAADGLVYYRAEIEAAMRIEQLVELLQGRPYAPLALRLVEANIEANDENRPTGLRTTMTWEGLFAPAKPEDAKTDKSAEAAKKTPRSAGGPGDKPATRILEEKRK